jgi:hypothetical protein
MHEAHEAHEAHEEKKSVFGFVHFVLLRAQFVGLVIAETGGFQEK